MLWSPVSLWKGSTTILPLVENAVFHDVVNMLALAVEQRDVGQRVAVDGDQVGAGAGGDDAELARHGSAVRH